MIRNALALIALLLVALWASNPCCASSSRPFVLAVVADGTAIGTLSGTLEVSVSDAGLTWTLSAVKFLPGPVQDGHATCNGDAVNGTGTAANAARAVIKDFSVIIARDSGVDISHRFRIFAVMEGDTLTGVAVEQQS